MSTTRPVGRAEQQIRELVEDRRRALAVKDAAALAAESDRGVVLFDVVGPLRRRGADDTTSRLEEWLASYEGGIDYEIRDLDITAGDGIAFCHYLFRLRGTMTGGTQVDMWVRCTLGLREMGGDWKVTHEHASVPIDATTGSAGFDLRP